MLKKKHNNISKLDVRKTIYGMDLMRQQSLSAWHTFSDKPSSGDPPVMTLHLWWPCLSTVWHRLATV